MDELKELLKLLEYGAYGDFDVVLTEKECKRYCTPFKKLLYDYDSLKEFAERTTGWKQL